ncbi:MAG: N-acetylglucosamine-6-phosphate deacetylase [Oscillospiraceae bacterium]|jgi:N-acetylglucosamine-6-phosphate deacetylase|nr:N-acetylglucosamine-6-phosphate deacetylase [Oscillospiraceae bacterium]
MLFKNGLVLGEDFRFSRADVRVTGEKIALIAPDVTPENESVIDLGDRLLLPGLINIHVHGALGHDFTEINRENFTDVRRFLALNGATSFLPTTLTLPPDGIIDALSRLSEYSGNDDRGAQMLGIHLEGPYLSPAYKGAHNADWLTLPRLRDFKTLQNAAHGQIKLVTVAPELDGAIDFIRGITPETRVSLGHGGTDYQLCREAFASGATQITHMFNVMPSLHHRNISLITAAFETGCFTELICDGYHVEPTVVQMAYRIFGDDHIVVITDGIAATGLPDGVYSFGGEVSVVTGGVGRLRDGTINGGTSTMIQAVRNLKRWGIPVESAVKMASYNSACAVDVQDHKGRIAIGYDADLLVVNTELSIDRVMLRGQFLESC